MDIANNSFFYKTRYFLYFILRAFLISIFILLVVFAFLLAFYFGDLFLNVKSGNYKSPLFNGYVIVSQSMVPTININDAIVIKRINNDKYNIGDIISFFSTEYSSDGMVITHRVVDKQPDTYNTSFYTTKGDNNPRPDVDLVNTSNIYGKVFLILPQLGKMQQFLIQPKNFAICLLLPAFIIIVYDVLRIRSAFLKR